MKHHNLFSPHPIDAKGDEFFEILLDAPDVRIERIVGLKPFDKPGPWYDQEEDEWVVLLQGEAHLEIKDEKIIHLKKGDFVFLPAHKVHRISKTKSNQKCIWLAVHGKLK